MRAAVVPEVKGRWEVRDVPEPSPGENQVLIRIRASGLCFTDVHITEGGIPTGFPRTLGHEPVGEIVRLGSGVASRKVGDRVGVPWVQKGCGRCEWCLRGKVNFCADGVGTGIQTQGGHAEFMVAEADSTMLVPDSLSYEQAAPIFCAGYTVWSGLRLAEPKPHEKIAIVGVGGLGHLGVQFSAAAGFETIAVSHSPDKDALLKQLGANVVVRDGEGLAKAGGADVILATGNSFQAVASCFPALRPDGRLVLMGVSEEPLEVPHSVLFRRQRILGSSQNSREHLYEALDMAARGKVKVMTETYPLEESAKVYDRVKEGRVRFRAVLLP